MSFASLLRTRKQDLDQQINPSSPAFMTAKSVMAHPLQQTAMLLLLGGVLWGAQGQGDRVQAQSVQAQSVQAHSVQAQSVQAQSVQAQSVYQPIPLKAGNLVKDSLSDKDIPTGKGSFARDYLIDLAQGDQIAIDLTSENFDTVVTLMTPNGTTMGENDDGPDGGTNSLLFMRITQSGSYIVRVQAFGQAKGGAFTLKLTHLSPSEKR